MTDVGCQLFYVAFDKAKHTYDAEKSDITQRHEHRVKHGGNVRKIKIACGIGQRSRKRKLVQNIENAAGVYARAKRIYNHPDEKIQAYPYANHSAY